MKKLLSILALTFLLATTAPALAEHTAGIEHDVTVKVNGMVCDFCAQSLKKIFGKEDAVNGIDVDLDTQTVTIDTKDGQTLNDAKIKELIEWGGYDFVSIERAK